MPPLPELFGTIERAITAVAGWRADRRMRRTLRRAPLHSLATMPEDTLARVCGSVHAFEDEVLEAPLSARPCVYWTVAVLTVGDDAADHISEAMGAFDADVRQRAVLMRLNLMGAHLGPRRTLRFREAVFAIAEPIAVHGTAMREPDPHAAARAGHGPYREAPTRLRFTGSKRYPLILSDDPRSR